MKEIWKDIPGYEGLYKVSNFGNVYIVKRKKLKKLRINKDGYYCINVSKNNCKKNVLVHRIVAEAFLSKNEIKKQNNEQIDFDLLLVNHKDENKLNNQVHNLEWCTNKYNVNYSKNKYDKKINKIIGFLEKEKIDETLKNKIIKMLIS